MDEYDLLLEWGRVRQQFNSLFYFFIVIDVSSEILLTQISI